MKDHQIESANVEPRIFLLSPILHCISMTALVFLRSDFGFGFLRPRSIFLASSWAFLLYAIYAWMDGDAWQQHRAVIWCGAVATSLYWFHLLRSVRREWRGNAKHEHYSGTPHLLYIARGFAASPPVPLDRAIRLWAEPAMALLAALGFYLLGSETHLSLWLVAAFCLWTKEILNQWFYRRRQKRRKDITDDAAEAFDGEQNHLAITSDPPLASARKAKLNRPRANVQNTGG